MCWELDYKNKLRTPDEALRCAGSGPPSRELHKARLPWSSCERFPRPPRTDRGASVPLPKSQVRRNQAEYRHAFRTARNAMPRPEFSICSCSQAPSTFLSPKSAKFTFPPFLTSSVCRVIDGGVIAAPVNYSFSTPALSPARAEGTAECDWHHSGTGAGGAC